MGTKPSDSVSIKKANILSHYPQADLLIEQCGKSHMHKYKPYILPISSKNISVRISQDTSRNVSCEYLRLSETNILTHETV